jgi:hypothetical protein
MRYLKPITIILAIALAAVRVQAQAPLPEVQPDPRYRVEIIVFAHNDANRAEEDFYHGSRDRRREPLPSLFRLPPLTLESVFAINSARIGDNALSPTPTPTPTPAPDAAESGLPGDLTPGPGDRLRLIERATDSPRPAGSTAIGANEVLPDGFRILAADERELGDTYATMRRIRPYRVLGYVGWLQTGVDTDRSVRLDLKRLGISNPVGTIELYRRRFLHVAVDLEYFDGSGTFWKRSAESGLAPLEYAESYRLVTEENAIRSGELHYIDHPLFGLLIRITPAPEPEDEADTGVATRPAA